MDLSCLHWVATEIWLSVNSSGKLRQLRKNLVGSLFIGLVDQWSCAPFCTINLLGDESTASFAVLMQGVHPNKMQRDVCCLSLWWWLLISNTCLQYFSIKGFLWLVRSHEWFWGLKRWQMDASKCLLCCTVARKEQITCIAVETSPTKNVVGLGGPSPFYCVNEKLRLWSSTEVFRVCPFTLLLLQTHRS